MGNKHSFNSTIIEKTDFNSIIKTKTNYNSYILNKKYYNSILDGFTQSNTLRIKFTQDNIINISQIIFSTLISSSIIVEPINIFISGSNISRNSYFTGIFNQDNNIYVIPTISNIIDSVIFEQDNNIFANLTNSIEVKDTYLTSGSISISASPIMAQYYTLSYFDPMLLNDISGSTLLQMDYNSG